VCSGFRAWLRLGQRLLRSKEGNGLWWGHLSSEIILEIKFDGSKISKVFEYDRQKIVGFEPFDECI
jgi:hypothetical protein